MNSDTLRNRFRSHVDGDTFRRFSIQLRRDANNDGARRIERLRYWQNALWDEFTSANSDIQIPGDIESIRASFLWCDVHEKYLVDGHAIPDRIGVTDRDGNRLNAEFSAALDDSFPFGFGYWKLICPDCVVECDAWMNANAAPNS